VAAIRTNVEAEAGASALYFMDLSRSIETVLVPTKRVTFVDWSPDNAFILYTIKDTGGREDLYYNYPNGSAEQNLTSTTDVAERAPRVDPGASTAAYERIDATGIPRIYVYQTIPVTSGDVVGAALPGTPYFVGSDADPAWAPDATRLVFRRLTGIGNGGLGTWDVLTVKTDGTDIRTVATGASFRGAPDWGNAGIVFVETDATAGESRLVLVQPDGTGRTVLRTEPSVYRMAAPRFLYGQ
jgi:Tol biopolymer transport system component